MTKPSNTSSSNAPTAKEEWCSKSTISSSETFPVPGNPCSLIFHISWESARRNGRISMDMTE